MTSRDPASDARDAAAWRELQRIVDGALDRPPERRARFVREACGDDAALRERALRLLDACARADRTPGVLDVPAAAFAAPVLDDVAGADAAAAGLRRTALERALREALDGRYAVERELGHGGMATVFLARDLRHDRAVAVKVLDRERVAGAGAARFLREIRTAARLTHPHVLSVYDSGEADDLLWYVMPYVEGETLRTRLARDGALPLLDAVRLVRELADALAHAHARGVVHRDVKPENVLLSGDHAVLADFGIARAAAAVGSGAPTGGAVTLAGLVVGTPAYMAPEQVAAGADADHRADLYALGVVAYEALAGVHPFGERPAYAMMAAHVGETPEPLARRRTGVPPALAGLVAALLAKRPADRPATADAVVRALDAVGAALREAHDAHAARAPRAPPAARSRGRVAALVATLAAAAAIGVALTLDWGRSSADAVRDAGGAAAALRADDPPSLAVLPVRSVGRDTLARYFADGMTDELAAALARTPGLRVAGRRSAYEFRDAGAPPAEIARALGVRYLLDATVRRAGDRVRVSAQLTSAADGMAAWSGTFDGDVGEVFALQDSITGAIVAALRLTLAAPGGASHGAMRTDVLEAHDLYLQGRFEAASHTRDGLLRAIALFRRAAALDSSYAPPWVGMADAYGWLADSYYPAEEAYREAKAALARALHLAPDMAEAHAVLGWVQLAYDWDAPAAVGTLRRAVALDSLSPLARSNYSYALWLAGDSAAALHEIRRALALDPLSAALSSNLEWHLFMRRRYDDVVAQHRVTDRLDPTYFFDDSWVAAAYRELGRHDEALAEYRAAAARQGGRALFGLAMTHARMGDTAAARAELLRLLDQGRRAHVPPDHVALVHVALGDADRAFEWLERAVRARTHSLAWMATNPQYDPVRADPRFAALVRRVRAR